VHKELEARLTAITVELFHKVVAFMRAYNQKKKLNPSLKPAAGVSGSRSVV